MKSGVILWMGPVSGSNLKPVNLPSNWDIVTIAQEVVAPQQVGSAVALTPSMFRAFASTLGPDPLGALMKRSRVDPELAIVASFSAGHGLLEPLLAANGGDSRIRAVLSADSYYGLEVKPGYSKQAQASIQSGVPFWLTTSDTKGGVTIHSGSESVAPFAKAMGLTETSWFPTGMPKPVASYNNGGVLWLDYNGNFSHIENVTKLAPMVLNIWFNTMEGKPNVPSTFPPVSVPPSGPISVAGGIKDIGLLGKSALVLAGSIVGYYGIKWVLRGGGRTSLA